MTIDQKYYLSVYLEKEFRVLLRPIEHHNYYDTDLDLEQDPAVWIRMLFVSLRASKRAHRARSSAF